MQYPTEMGYDGIQRGQDGARDGAMTMESSHLPIEVCLKIVYPIVPNGFADHYPY